MSTKRKILLSILSLIVVIQFFQIDKENPAADPKLDFIQLEQPSNEVTAILKNACYDCHSYHTKYPWYSYIAPVSWIIGHDIEEAREHLNFSEWGNYSEKKAHHKLEECYEEVEEGEMPLTEYVNMHPEASLTETQKEILEYYFKSIK